MSRTKPFGADRCPNCGEYGAHFAPPSLGEEGFFICKENPGWKAKLRRTKMKLVKEEKDEEHRRLRN
jgi:hypothetical protein